MILNLADSQQRQWMPTLVEEALKVLLYNALVANVTEVLMTL
jgi:hypothetical protein